MPGQARRLLRSFAGGEIAPEMYGRIDLDKMQTGLARVENFEILPHGPARRRASPVRPAHGGTGPACPVHAGRRSAQACDARQEGHGHFSGLSSNEGL